MVPAGPPENEVPWDVVREHVQGNTGWIDGIVVSGGEPTIHAGWGALLEKVRALELPVKLDTNGSAPGALTRGGYAPPTVGGTTQVPLDPLTGEDISGDTKFFLRWVVVVKGDGLPPLVAKAGSAPEGGAP